MIEAIKIIAYIIAMVVYVFLGASNISSAITMFKSGRYHHFGIHVMLLIMWFGFMIKLIFGM